MRRAFKQILKKEGSFDYDDGEDDLVSTLSEEDDRQRMSELTWEIENLHLSTKQALQISAVEAERLRAQNDNLRHHVSLLQTEIDHLDLTLEDVKRCRRVQTSSFSSDGDHITDVASVTESGVSNHSRWAGGDECKPFADISQGCEVSSEDGEISYSDESPYWSQHDDRADNLRAPLSGGSGALRRYRRLLKQIGTSITKHSGNSNRREISLHVEQELMSHLALLENDMKRTIQDLEAVLESKTSEVNALETLIKEQNQMMLQKREKITYKRKRAFALTKGTLKNQKNGITYKILELKSEVSSKRIECQRLKSLLLDQSAEMKSYIESLWCL
jgi:hypothetical protein